MVSNATIPRDLGIPGIGGPFLEFEISECEVPLDDIIAAVEKNYPDWKFWATEPRYESCIMAIFERR